jgi:Na+-driven multidrug efflux pump
MLITAAASAGVGLLAAQLFLRAQLDESLRALGLAYYLILVTGLVAAMGVIASTLPLLNRMTGPEIARND